MYHFVIVNTFPTRARRLEAHEPGSGPQEGGAVMPCPTRQAPFSHDRLRLDLMAAGSRVMAAGSGHAFLSAREELASYCTEHVLPHLEADERWLTEADGCPEARLLARALRAEARAMTGAVDELTRAETPCEAMASARVLHTLLAAHAHHELLLVEAMQDAPG